MLQAPEQIEAFPLRCSQNVWFPDLTTITIKIFIQEVLGGAAARFLFLTTKNI